MSTHDTEDIGRILSRLLECSDLGTTFDHAQIWEKWPEIVGPEFCKHGIPDHVRDHVLYVYADSSVWMHRFVFRKWDIILHINKRAGRELICDLFVALRPDMPPTNTPPQG